MDVGNPAWGLAVSIFRDVRVVAAMAGVVLLPGCGKDDPTSFHVKGVVTHLGEPIPRGVIYFDPDPAQLNRGPQGYAVVEHGVYDTRDGTGRGVVGGPYRVRVSGFDGLNRSEMLPYGRPIFAEHMIEKTFPKEDSEWDIDVP